MSKAQFTNVVIRYVDVRPDKEAGGLFVRIHLTADWSTHTAEIFGWEQIPDSISSAKLAGTLLGQRMILTPADGLQMHELHLDVHDVSDFQVSHVKVGENSTKIVLAFVIRTRQEAAAASLEAYLRVIGRGQAMLSITQAVQQTNLFDEEESAEDVEVDSDDELDDIDETPVDAEVLGPIPTDPEVPEWRTQQEIAAGVPHHIEVPASDPPPAATGPAQRYVQPRRSRRARRTEEA